MTGQLVQLGPNQKKWLEGQKASRLTYPSLGDIGDIPSEELLEKLSRCKASGWNTSCFSEGACIYPNDLSCPHKEKK